MRARPVKAHVKRLSGLLFALGFAKNLRGTVTGRTNDIQAQARCLPVLLNLAGCRKSFHELINSSGQAAKRMSLQAAADFSGSAMLSFKRRARSALDTVRGVAICVATRIASRVAPRLAMPLPAMS